MNDGYAMSEVRLSQKAIDQRITFDEANQIMEISFEGLTLANSREVNAFYDRIEERIHDTGEALWFFLVDYSGARIDQSAWFAFSRRGKELNLAHSMGTVRVDASEATRRQIERDAQTEAFDPNLFGERERAVAYLSDLPTKRRQVRAVEPTLRQENLDGRLLFDSAAQIMEVDFRGLSFENSRDVDLVYDWLERELEEQEGRWYFLVNYENTQIAPAAWVQYAQRGKRLNQQWSLGSVRFAPGLETEADIRLRAESQGFRPNIRNTREEALERIAEMKAEGRD